MGRPYQPEELNQTVLRFVLSYGRVGGATAEGGRWSGTWRDPRTSAEVWTVCSTGNANSGRIVTPETATTGDWWEGMRPGYMSQLWIIAWL